MPFLLQWLLDTYGFRIALRVWAVVLVAIILLFALMVNRPTNWTGHRLDTMPVLRERALAHIELKCVATKRSSLF